MSDKFISASTQYKTALDLYRAFRGETIVFYFD